MTFSSDTPDFAADTLEDWWRHSETHYSKSKRLMIEADAGGSNGPRSRRYKKRLQDFADKTGLEITVCHYPPGASKWNPIEHRLFSQITASWAGYVLSSLMVLLCFLRRTTTSTGLRVTATHLDRTYPKGMKVTKAEFEGIQLTRHDVCPQWNYTIRPRPALTAGVRGRVLRLAYPWASGYRRIRDLPRFSTTSPMTAVASKWRSFARATAASIRSAGNAMSRPPDVCGS